MKLAVVIIWCSILIKDVRVQDEEGDSCVDNENQAGICKPLEQCSGAAENLKDKIFPTVCGFKGKVALICCVNSSNSTVAEVKPDVPIIASNSTRIPGEISTAKCMEYSNYSYRNILSPLLTIKPQYEKIYECRLKSEILTINTQVTSIEEYPHMAHVGYENSDNVIEYLCGGSLISEIFVLTVAHCGFSRTHGEPKIVRFGVTNVDNYKHRQEIKIADIFVYSEYRPNAKYHDIGLLKLEKPVEINQFTRPACLNTIRDINYKTAIVTGWGRQGFRGEPSKDLLKSILTIISTKKCNKTYPITRPMANGIVEDLMICAAISSDQRKDTCQGDSGSALQVSFNNSKELQCMSLIIGITSLGKGCGIVGLPGVYTRVSNYIKWIEDIVWPENM